MVLWGLITKAEHCSRGLGVIGPRDSEPFWGVEYRSNSNDIL